MTDATASALADALGNRYTIERELGRGGMATVYLARDLKHGRPVALKVLRPELAHLLGPDRFLHEIRTTARLQHTHILSVIDSGETAGYLWFTMRYVPGESLRERLRREKQLPVEEALRIVSEAAHALDYAHREGVVHRDIKPENILLTTEGDTLVADFGIGLALGATSPEERLTEIGLLVGTPTYMSPEQSAGERALDGRADIYSLGVVLYELLAGEPPCSGPTAQAVLARRLTGEVPRIRHARPAVPEQIDLAIAKALALLPADRHATGDEFARALAVPVQAEPPVRSLPWSPRRRMRTPLAAVTLALGFLLGVGVLFGWLRTHAGDEAGSPRRVAVLPFENVGDSADAYFADGVTDAVRGKLAGVPGLLVIASASANEYKHTTKSPRVIARELGVTYLLVGKIRWEKGGGRVNHVQVSPELIDLTNPGMPTTRWQQPFDARLTDVFQVQADIAGRVTEELNVALGKSQRETLGQSPTHDLAAYDAYLKGEELLKSGIDMTTLRRAVAEYEQAVTLDSSFVAAWAQLSRAHSFLYGAGQITAADAGQSRAAAGRALALAPNRFEGHLALGDYYSYVQGDNVRAAEQYAMAQRAAPSNVQALAAAGGSKQGLGQWDAAVADFRQALTLDPRAVRTAIGLARSLLWLRRYPEAIQAEDRALALAPSSLAALEDRAMIYLAQGDLAGARTVLRTAPADVEPAALIAFVAQTCDLYWVLDDGQQRLLLRLAPEAFDSRGTWGLALAGTYALRGDQPKVRVYADSARISLQEQLRATPGDAQLHVLLGTALAYLGRRDEAVSEGRQAIALLPVSKDAFTGAYVQHQLARIYLLIGEPEQALDQLEPLLSIPYFLSPRWLRIDPTFDPLRGNPRFQRLAHGS